jgi:hypothetical protein
MGKLALQLGARNITIVVSVVGATLLGASQIPAIAAPAPPHSRAAIPALAPMRVQGNSIKGTITATRGRPDMPPPCSPTPKGDYVHISSSGPPPQASAHAYWLKNNCKVNRALVTVQLQEYYSDHSWRNKGTLGSKTIPSGKIPLGQRPNGRATCTGGTALTSWRSVVWVGTIGEWGLNEQTTAVQNIKCRVR